MARMLPERPYDLSSAERRFYEACVSLPDEYVVLARLPVLEPGYESDADFLIGSPEWGIIVVEVKGGQVGCDAGGQWYSVDRNGVRHPLKRSPFDQAQANAHRLNRFLQRSLLTRDHTYPFGWAVAIPDGEVDHGFGTIPRDVILDRRDLKDLERALARVARFSMRHPWSDPTRGRRALEALTRVLGESMLARRPLRVDVEEIQWQLVELTEDQYNLLKMLGNRREARIRGCAGSGKTFIAMRMARTMCSRGYRVLLTCFNRPLADWMQYVMSAELDQAGMPFNETGAPPEKRLPTVMTFHQLCVDMASRYGIELPGNDARPRDPSWAEALSRAAACSGPRFDAVIVDEGQDFAPEWWIPLLDLREPDGFLYIFYDDNQRLYGEHAIEFPITDEPFFLYRNVRFTRQIHQAVVPFYHGEPEPQSPPVDGSPPVYLFGSGIRGDRHLLSKVLHDVLVEGRVDPRDLVILTPCSQRRSALQEQSSFGNFVLTWDRKKAEEGSPYVLVSSIHRFKGLERPVVVLAELEVLEDYPESNRNMLLYVGLSRASAKLFLLGGRLEWLRPGALAPVQAPLEGTVEEEPLMPARAMGEQTPPDDGTVRDTSPPTSRVPEDVSAEAVFIDCDPKALEGNRSIAQAVGSGRAYVVDDPPGLLIQAWDTPLPRGKLKVVKRLSQLPFTRSGWLVLVQCSRRTVR